MCCYTVKGRQRKHRVLSIRWIPRQYQVGTIVGSRYTLSYNNFGTDGFICAVFYIDKSNSLIDLPQCLDLVSGYLASIIVGIKLLPVENEIMSRKHTPKTTKAEFIWIFLKVLAFFLSNFRGHLICPAVSEANTIGNTRQYVYIYLP